MRMMRITPRWINGRWLAISLLCLLAAGLWSSGVAAQDADLRDSLKPKSQTSYTFGQAIDFRLELTNDPPLESATLFISAPDFDNAFTVAFEIDEPEGQGLTLAHRLSLTDFRLHPFTTVTYWWVVRGEDGQTLELNKETLAYDDNQFEWQQVAQDGIQVYWVGDSVELGQIGLELVESVLPEMQAVLGTRLPERPLRIYLYPTTNDLQSAMRLNGIEWVAGHANPELGVIMLAVNNALTARTELSRSLPHELSHILLHAALRDDYANAPRWFDEGIATQFELIPNPNYEPALQAALTSESLIPFEELCTEFPEQTSTEIYQAYGQSRALVGYLRTTYGERALRDMISAINDGADCEAAVQRAVGLSLTEVVDGWLGVEQPSLLQVALTQNGVWLLLVVLGAGLSLLVFVLPRKR